MILKCLLVRPGTTILNYLTRSISSERGKDAGKMDRVVWNVLSANPDVADWMIDGPGASQFVFARILHTLRSTGRAPSPLVVGEKLSLDPVQGDLTEHPFFIPKISGGQARLAIALARAKSVGLGVAESAEFIREPFQTYLETTPFIASKIHNSKRK